jgi:hypothetical protein
MTDDERDAGDDRSGAEDGTASTAEHSVDDWLAAAQTSPAAGRRRRGERRDAGPDEKRRGGGMAVPIIAVSVAVATVIGASFVIFGDALGLRGDETSAGPATISASARPGAAQGGPSSTPTPTPRSRRPRPRRPTPPCRRRRWRRCPRGRS